jgi:hypothetical protein
MMVQWTIRQALICWIASSCITLSLSLSGYHFWIKAKQKKLSASEYKIVSIVQTGSEKEALKTVYLAELLGLSANRFVSLYGLDCKEAEKKLLASPLIRSAFVKRMPPNTLYIDYEIRRPIAKLSDYENIGIDKEGYVFPIAPFFSPKELPDIYLGLPAFGEAEDRLGRKGAAFHTPLCNSYFLLASEILQFLETAPWREGFRLKKIDVSNAAAPSLGQREIVLFTEEDFRCKEQEREICCTFPKILRLAPKDYAQQLNHFFTLRRKMAGDYKRQLPSMAHALSEGSGEIRFQPRIIDLRIPQLAFVENY